MATPQGGSSDGTPRGRRGAAPFVNSGAALVLLLVIGLTALTATQGPPPAIAEISPQANEQITDAPEEQSSDMGEGAGGGAGGDSVTTTTTEPPNVPTTVVPRSHRCVGDPPRQIEDPHSPPCIPFWEGDNGGATWQGVTADEVIVGIPNYDAGNSGIVALYEAFFNNRFEFYGRKLRLIDSTRNGDPSMDGPEGGKAVAAISDEELKVFASGAGNPQAFHFYDELGRRGVPVVNTEVKMTDAYLQRMQHIYSYRMGVDTMFENFGEWACKRLAGGNATHAGGDQLGQPRKFGIILHRGWGDSPVTSKPLQDQLKGCGVEPVVIEHTCNCTASLTPQMTAAEATNAMVQMSQAGVTSIFCLCEPADMALLMRTATAQRYYPEWLVTDYVDLANTFLMKTLAGGVPEQAEHVFGITFSPRLTTVQSTPAFWAVWEVDPSYNFQQASRYYFAVKQYWAILLLASGIQMAGPNLTPERFREGLAKAVFPNPTTPLMAGSVGFNDPLRSHSFTKDGTELWWSNAAPDPYPGGGPGAYCYVDGGRRYRRGGWPSGGDPFFQGPCDNGSGI